MKNVGIFDETALAIARELVAALRPMVQGVQVSARSGRLDVALDVLDGLS